MYVYGWSVMARYSMRLVMRAHTHTPACLKVYTCMYIHIVCKHVYMYTCVYMFTCVYMHTKRITDCIVQV